MDNKFFTFFKPYFSFIDNGDLYRKPFSWLYLLMAILNLLLPVYILYKAIDNKIFDSPPKYLLLFVLLWAVISFVSWLSFQLWWDRKSKVVKTSAEGDDFVATPVFSHLIQTFGEWMGTWVAVVGFSVALLSTMILGDEGHYFSYRLGLGFLETGYLFIILMPVYGFLIIVVTRFLAEQFRALSSIANNTRKNYKPLPEQHIDDIGG